MSTITKERVAQYANDPRMCNVNDEIRQIALIALASLEAGPVASCIVEDGGMCIDGFGEYVGHSLPDGPHQLYAAPPAPVSAPDFKKLARELVENLVDCDGADDSAVKQYLKWTEKTCRDAMLQGKAEVSDGN